jgi:hypothetical protein
MRHVARHVGDRRVRQAIRPLRGVDVVVVERDAGEMPGQPLRARAARHGATAETDTRRRRHRDVVQHAATMEGVDAGRPQATPAER